ncbi:hypothetical protein [Streptomyces microflavus]|uniref:hypothetical protein n=1 Tax=Streptomyces microflavus TaxID=1919 RepID=UPI0036ECE1F8
MIHIAIRHTDRFTVVGNDLAQHPGLSTTAVGFAVRIQSLPQGTEVGIKALAARFPEGEKLIAAALRELEAHGYLQRARTRLPNGRIVTRTVFCNQPTALLRPRVAATPPQQAPAAPRVMAPVPVSVPAPARAPGPALARGPALAPAPKPEHHAPEAPVPEAPVPEASTPQDHAPFVPLVPPTPPATAATAEPATHTKANRPPPDEGGNSVAVDQADAAILRHE